MSNEASMAPIIKVSREHYREFFDGEVWADLVDILAGRLQYARALLETHKDHVEILKTQGAIEELKYLIDLQDTIMEDYTFEEGKSVIPLGLKETDDDN